MAGAVPDDLIDVPDDLVDVPAAGAAPAQPGVPQASPWLDQVVKARQAGLPQPAGPAPARRQAPQRSLTETIRGYMEAGVEAISQVVGGGVGFAGGAIGGLGGIMSGARFAAPTREQGVATAGREWERTAAEGAERGAGAVRGVLRGLLWDGAEVSPAGQEGIDALTKLAHNAPAIVAAPRGTTGFTPQQPLGVKPVLQAVGDTARAAGSRAVDAALPTLDPGTVARVQKATAEGIPISPHQLTENRVARIIGESAEHIPFTGGGKLRKSRIEGFSRGLAALIDPEAAKGVKRLDSATFRTLQDAAGERIGEITGRTSVPKEAFGDLMDVVRDNDPAVQTTISNFARDVAAAADQHGGVVPGPTLRELRTRALTAERETKASKGDLSAAWDRVGKRLDDALAEHAAEGDIPALLEARRQYAVSKALEPLVADNPNGRIPPGRLHDVLTATQKGKTRMARGTAGEQGEYARLGSEILSDVVFSENPSRHIAFQGAGAAATGGLALFNAPAAAALWAGSALYNLAGPRAVKWLANRQAKRMEPVPGAPPPPLELAPEGPLPPRPAGEAPAAPLGDLTPEWETAPGAAPAAPRAEIVPAEGLVPAVDSLEGPARVRPAGSALEQPPARGAGQEIPAVPGRPDLPETVVAGPPAELAPTEAVGAAMQEPTTVLARRQQEAARLAAETQSPEVQRVLAEHARKLEQQAAKEAARQKRLQDAAELRRVAAQTADPEIQQALHARAATLEAAEPVPAGKAKELDDAPAAKPAKGPNKPVPAGEATEVVPEVVEPAAVAAPTPLAKPTEPRVGKAGPKDKFVVGRVYRDSQGNMAVRQADGSWKEVK